MPLQRSLLAPLLDAICLALFVALGRESHGIGRGPGWFVEVLWPFAVGWFVVAVIVVGLALRAGVTHRGSLSTFAIVVYVFVGLAVFGWRALATALRRLRP